MVGCTQNLTPVETPVIEPPDNNFNPTNPDPKNDPKPDPEPEPKFTLEEGWYQAEVELDILITNTVAFDFTMATTCTGIAAFEYLPEQDRIEGFWECWLPGIETNILDLIDPTSALDWQGSVMREIFGTYEPDQCTGELEDGLCHFRGQISGALNPQTGQLVGSVSTAAAEEGAFNELGVNWPGVLQSFFDSLGSALFTIDRTDPFTGFTNDNQDIFMAMEATTGPTELDFRLEDAVFLGNAPSYVP